MKENLKNKRIKKTTKEKIIAAYKPERTIREIQKIAKVSSPSLVHFHLRNEGLITKATGNPEINALKVCYKMLAGLDKSTRERAIKWLKDKFDGGDL